VQRVETGAGFDIWWSMAGPELLSVGGTLCASSERIVAVSDQSLRLSCTAAPKDPHCANTTNTGLLF
jgi:hypothetical protein